MKRIILCAIIALSASVAFAVKPNPQLTPGELCTPTNPDFSTYRYPAHIAYCRRDVTYELKLQIAKAYGIPESEWHNYEFDHLIPLNAGGDSSVANIWPQPIAEAKEKDKLEYQIYQGLSNGTLNQQQAVQLVSNWIAAH